MRLSKRLMSVTELIDNNSNVIDVGCDHALLDVYLTKYKECNCIAIDNKKKCYLKSKANIQDLDIKLKLQDGIENNDILNDSIVVMLGLGTSSISKILKKISHNNVKRLIIQSNNDLYDLRVVLVSLGYYIKNEYVIYEKHIFYTIIVFEKGYKKYSYKELFLGPVIIKNKDPLIKKYYLNIYNRFYERYRVVPNTLIIKKIKLLYHLILIKKLI